MQIWNNHGMCGDMIYCRRLRRPATGRTAARHVDPRHWNIFCLI